MNLRDKYIALLMAFSQQKSKYSPLVMGKKLQRGAIQDNANWCYTEEYIYIPDNCTSITVYYGYVTSSITDILNIYNVDLRYRTYYSNISPYAIRTIDDFSKYGKIMRFNFYIPQLENCYVYDNTNKQYLWKYEP